MAAAGAWTLTDAARRKLVTGQFDLDSDTFKCALFTSSSNLDASATTYAGLNGEVANANGYTTGGLPVAFTLTGTTSVTAAFTSNPVWTASGGSLAARFAVVYEVGGDVLAFAVLDSAPADMVATAGSTLTVAGGGGVLVVGGTAVPKVVSFVDAQGASTTSLATMPAHQAGDLLIAYVTSTNASATLTPPSGWSNITLQSTTQKACRLAYKVAASDAEPSGTWSDAIGVTILSYRNAGTPGGWSAQWGTSSSSVPYPAIAAANMTRTDGTSWVLRLGYAHNGTSAATMPGYTSRIARASTQNVYDSNAGVSTAGAVSASGSGTSTSYLTYSLEIPAGN